jgi:hypothetical protein
MLFIFVFCKVGFESLCQFPPREHDAPPTTFAFQPDIRAKTRDRPFIGTTWMLFAKSQMVVEAEVREHIYLDKSERVKYDYYKLNCDKLRTRNFV